MPLESTLEISHVQSNFKPRIQSTGLDNKLSFSSRSLLFSSVNQDEVSSDGRLLEGAHTLGEVGLEDRDAVTVIAQAVPWRKNQRDVLYIPAFSVPTSCYLQEGIRVNAPGSSETNKTNRDSEGFSRTYHDLTTSSV